MSSTEPSADRPRDAWIARDGAAEMRRRRPALLRAARRAGAVTLGPDGRPLPGVDPLDGLMDGAPEELGEAASIVDRARDRVDEMLREARSEAGAIEERAHRAGFERGMQEGEAAARAELAEALALVQRAASDEQAVRDRLYANVEAELIEMVIAATEAVIGESVASDPELVTETVRRALERAGTQNVVRVRVHPDRAAPVEAWFAERRDDVTPYAVVGDAAIAIGGCIVDTSAGLVDARLDVELAEVARLLRSAVPPGAPAAIRDTMRAQAEEAA